MPCGIGRAVIVGQSTSLSVFAVIRLTTSGAADTSFDSDGVATVDFGASTETGFAVTLDAGGNIVVAGQVNSTSDFAIARLLPSGSLDTSFDTDGRATVNFGSGLDDRAYSLVVQNDGRIVVAGTTSGGGGNFAFARFNANGTLDSSFGTGGLVTIDIGTSSSDGVNTVTLDTSGRLATWCEIRTPTVLRWVRA